VIMTFFIMQPVGVVMYRDSVLHCRRQDHAMDAVVRAGAPMRQFMSHYVREKDAALFLEMAKEPRPRTSTIFRSRAVAGLHSVGVEGGFRSEPCFFAFSGGRHGGCVDYTSVGMMQFRQL